MENHPIPQDVTGFKFKLIGSITVKQFLYIMGGGILAAICYILPISAFIKIPLSLLFGGLGAAVALIPIEGRPMDIMLKNFLKALPAENEYIFKKRGAEALISEFFTPAPVIQKAIVAAKTQEDSNLTSKRELLYKTLRVSSSYKADEKEQAVLSNLNQYFNESSHSTTPPIQNIDAVPKDIPQPLQIVHPTQIVQPSKPIIKSAPPVLPTEQTEPDQQAQIAQVEIAPVEAIPIQTITPDAPKSSIMEPVAAATPIAPEAQLKGGFPHLPDTPNIVLGIVKDPRGRVLPNILVEIMDTQGIPVRAFKTNALGQFTAATPLSNGEYTMILEDARKINEFEKFTITLDGKIFEPLEIVSSDQREKLRQELFGTTNQGAQVQASA